STCARAARSSATARPDSTPLRTAQARRAGDTSATQRVTPSSPSTRRCSSPQRPRPTSRIFKGWPNLGRVRRQRRAGAFREGAHLRNGGERSGYLSVPSWTRPPEVGDTDPAPIGEPDVARITSSGALVPVARDSGYGHLLSDPYVPSAKPTGVASEASERAGDLA